MVMSRGIVGTKGDIPTVASPIHKQRYDLRDGRGIDDPAVTLPAYPVRVLADGMVQVLAG
jgi:nitrite reductase (NADH) small subunit